MHAVMRLLEYEAGRSLGARGCSVTRLSVYIGLKKSLHAWLAVTLTNVNRFQLFLAELLLKSEQ